MIRTVGVVSLSAGTLGEDFVRHELGQSMIIRYAPEILFEEDHNIEYGIHIASVLRQVRPEEETNDESSDGQE